MHDDEQPSFSAAELYAIDRALDAVIPPSADGRLPGAGQIGVSRYVDRALRTAPHLREMFTESIAALERLAAQRGGASFAELPAAEQAALVDQLANSADAFPPILILHGFSGYYQHPDVLAVLGLGARPPHPEGYPMEPNDLSLLDAVRRRGPMYRRVER